MLDISAHLPLPPLLKIQVNNLLKEELQQVDLKKDEVKELIAGVMSGYFFQQNSARIPQESLDSLHGDLLSILQRGLAWAEPNRPPLVLRWHAPQFNTIERQLIPWHFVQTEMGWSPQPGSCVGTCYREIPSPLQNQLFNCYSQHHTSELGDHFLIRHAVVNTTGRLEMLMSLLRKLLLTPSLPSDENALSQTEKSTVPPPAVDEPSPCLPELPYSVIIEEVGLGEAREEPSQIEEPPPTPHFAESESSNSVKPVHRVRLLSLLTRRQDDHEERVWQDQFDAVQQLCDPEMNIVHVGLQCNANTNFNIYNHGEDVNAIRNAPAFLQYSLWLMADAQAMWWPTPSLDMGASENWTSTPDGYNYLAQLMAQVEQVLALSHRITEADYGKLWFTRQGWFTGSNVVFNMISQLVSRDLPWLEDAIKLRLAGEGHRLFNAVRLLLSLLRSQYPNATSAKAENHSRTGEFLMLALLDRSLGIHGCVNCKSGCDRSALVHALTTALYVLLEQYPTRHDMLVHVCQEFVYLCEKVDACTDSFSGYLERLDAWTRSDTDLDWCLRLVCELRNCVFVVLMQMAWKVNIYSTGLAGLKWHLGSMKGNPHVPLALPPFVIGCQPNIHVVEVHRRGKMDPKFASFLNGASNFRGA